MKKLTTKPKAETAEPKTSKPKQEVIHSTNDQNVNRSFIKNTAWIRNQRAGLLIAILTAGAVGVAYYTFAASGLRNQRPYGVIETPAAGQTVNGSTSTTYRISGWALDNQRVSESAIGNVYINVDNVYLGLAKYGDKDDSRPDICARYTIQRPGCPNIGWHYDLNTSSLSTGPHKITVVFDDKDPRVHSYGTTTSFTFTKATATNPPPTTGGGSTTTSPPVTGSTPQVPQSYNLPSNYIAVTSTATLGAALNGASRDIVLENGDYPGGTALFVGSHRLWSRTLGGATLHYGLELGGNGTLSGPEIHGLKFDITNGVGHDGAAIGIWGNAGQNAVVADTWIYGHRSLGMGVLTRNTNGFRVNRVIANGFKDNGIYWQTYYPDYRTDNPAVKPVVTDVDVSAVYRDNRGSSDGTAEAGIWAGTGCDCQRIKIRDTGWMGLWTGSNENGGVFSNFDINDIHGTVPSTGKSVSVGIYLEHFSRRSTFKNFVIGSASNTGVETGVVCEWADPAYVGQNPEAGQSIAGCHNNTFSDSTYYTSFMGISLEDADTTTIKNIKFVGQSWAGIKDLTNPGYTRSTIWQNQGNDFSGMKPGTPQIRYDHE